jgi:hypothetical protein
MKRVVLILLIAVIAVFAFTAVAYAASPTDIYNAYVANPSGFNPGAYTTAEWQAFLAATNDATFVQYKSPEAIASLTVIAHAQISKAGGTDDEDTTGTFPFTGFEMMITLLGGMALVGSGLLIRKWAR